MVKSKWGTPQRVPTPAPDRTKMCCLGHNILEQMVMVFLGNTKKKGG